MSTPQKNVSSTPEDKSNSSLRSAWPEAVRLAVSVWALAVGLEVVHQILAIVMGVVDPAELLTAAREAGAADQLPGDTDAGVRLTALTAIVLMGLFNLAIVTVLAVALRLFATKHRMAGGSRRLLMIFSLFWALRGMLVFSAQPSGTDVPQFLYLLDGSVQLIIAVAAVLGIIFSQREDTLNYTGELEQAKELAKKMEDEKKNKRK